MSGDHAHAHGHSHSHGHAHGPVVGVSREAQRRALLISLVANGGFLIAELVGGIVFRSLALLADAAHMMTDVVGLVIALVALVFIRWVNRAGRAFGIADTLPCRPSLWQGTSKPSNRR